MKDFMEYHEYKQQAYHIPTLATANMDKTPIPYAPKRKHTIACRGAKLVKAKRLESEVKVTGALTVTKGGEKIKPFMIFTGKRTAQSMHYNKMKRNRTLYPQTDIHCTCSPKAGMTLEVMLEWIKTI